MHPDLRCADLVEAVTDYLEQLRRTISALRKLPVEALDAGVASALPRRA